MSLLLLYRRGTLQAEPGGIHFGRNVSLPKQVVIDARLKAEQFEALQTITQARQGPVQVPVLPVPPPVKDTQAITAGPLQADTTQADALMARLLAGRVVPTPVEATIAEPTAAEMTDDEMYMLMTLALEVMA